MLFQMIVLAVPGSRKVLRELTKGPINMSSTVAAAAADVQELIKKGLAVYENGALRLLRDAAEPQPKG